MRKPYHRARGPHFPALDQIVQYDFEPGYVVFTMPAPKRLRVKAAGEVIADTTEGLVLYESDHLPIYYFPIASVRMDLFEKSERRTFCPYKGEATHYSMKGQNGAYGDIMWRYEEPVPACPPIADYVSFYWHEVDHWYEEDEEVFVHARDPYRRVDCLPSSRRVQVFLDGEQVADSRRGVFLFETGLPTRYYLPLEDVRADLLQASEFTTQCPYKGDARYYQIKVKDKLHDQIIWYYPEPVHEAARIKGLVCFANEFVDRILVDGVEQPRPMTAFSHGYNYIGYKD